MKKLLTILFLFFCFAASGQVIQKNNTYGIAFNRTGADTLFYLPQDTFAVPTAYRTKNFITRKGTTIYQWNTSSFLWQALSGAGGGGSAINMFGQAWVDSATGNNGTAQVGNPALPYSTINAALDALASYHTAKVNIGLGSYERIDSSKIRSNLVIMGSGMPRLDNSDTATSLVNITIPKPTKLLGGTIIKGGLQIRNMPSNLEIGNLGFDNGSAFVAAGNRKWDALDIRDPGTNSSSTPPFKQMQGIYIHDIVCLGDTSTSAYHALTIENAIDPVVKNVLLVGNTHGLAVKTVGGIYDGITSYWHSSDCAILKINNYAPSHEMVLTNFVFRSLSESDRESEGLLLQNETGVAVRTGYVISNGTIRFTKTGIRDYGAHDMYNVNISNVTIHKTTNSGVHLTLLSKGNINNVIVDSTGGNGFWIQSTGGGNILSNNQALVNTYKGFDITGGTDKTYLYNNYARGNNEGIVASDANVVGEDNIALSNPTNNFSGTISGVLKPYLSSGALSVVGASTAGLLQKLYIGSGLSVSSGGGVDTLKASGGGGGGGSTVVSDSAWMLTGNSVSTGIKYLGTTNNRSVNVITNNTITAKIDSAGNWSFNPGAAAGYTYKFASYNDDDFVKIGYGNVSESGVVIGRDVNFDSYPRLRLIGYDDTYPLLWLGNGGNESSAKWFAYGTPFYGLGFECNNYNNLPFTNKGYQEFQDRTYFGGALGSRATAYVNIAAGTASANTSPLKFTSGVASQTIKEPGAVNYDGSDLTLSDATYAYALDKSLTGSASLDFGSTSAQNSADLTITVTGASDGDVVNLGVPNGSVNANSCYTAWVSAANTVTVRFNNYSSGSIDPASGTFKVRVNK